MSTETNTATPPRKKEQVRRLPSINSEPSQADKILECLRARRPRWVPMPYLSAISGSLNIHTRIDDLRRKGFDIVNDQRTKRDSRTRDSFYRLAAEPGENIEQPAPPQQELPLS